MRRLTRDPTHPVTAKARYVRMRLAFILEGHGACTRLAIECDCRSDLLSHVISGKPSVRGGRPRRSARLEALVDAYIERVFAQHQVKLDWKVEE